MKKLFIIFFLLLTVRVLYAQDQQEHKIDSLCKLVIKYFNARDIGSIYSMAGDDFKKALSAEAFKSIMENNLFPLGNIRETVFQHFRSGVSEYKAVFASTSMILGIGLDRRDKLAAFYFKPYVDEGTQKEVTIPTDNPRSSDLDLAVDSAVNMYMKQEATTGMSVGVIRNGREYYFNYGETARGNGQLPDEHTIYEIGSITKTFTAILLADAVRHRKVKLDDPLNEYLPDSIPPMSFGGSPITLRSMANHTSGLPRMPDNFHPSNPFNPYKDYHHNDLYSFYAHFRPVRKPGEKYEYSNLAFGTLGVILTRIYRENFATLVASTITTPLGMAETKEFLSASDSVKFAKGYTKEGLYTPPWEFGALDGAGALRSTVHDMLIYAKANWGKAPARLRRDIRLTHEVTFENDALKTGLAWLYIRAGTAWVIFHNGGTGGYHSFLAFDPDKKIALVLLSNCALETEDTGNMLIRWLEENPG